MCRPCVPVGDLGLACLRLPPVPPCLPLPQSGGDTWTCWAAFTTVAAHPEAVNRPATLCKALYKCRWGVLQGWRDNGKH